MMYWCCCSVLFLLLIDHLATFSSAADYFDGPIVPNTAIPYRLLGSDSEQPGFLFSEGKKQQRKLTVRPIKRIKRIKTTPNPHSSQLNYNETCRIERYQVTTTISKNQFVTNITHNAYLIKGSASNASNFRSEHVLSLTTSISKNYTFESVDHVPCANEAEGCRQLRHWIYSLTDVNLNRYMVYKPNNGNNSHQVTQERERYRFGEKVDWRKYHQQKYSRPFTKVFKDLVYIRDLCRGPGNNQLYECYSGIDGQNRCLCLRDKRPDKINQKWLHWDKKRKMCVAPVEKICAIRDTITDYKKSPILCEEGSVCGHTTGLDPNYVFCSRIDSKARDTRTLFKDSQLITTSFAHQIHLSMKNQYLQFSVTCLMLVFMFYF